MPTRPKKPAAKPTAKRRALITGITGQDGSYLAELLVEKGYEVYGLVRRVSTDPFVRIKKLQEEGKIQILNGNLHDLTSIVRALQECNPDEIYNLAAQSHVGLSFTCPEETVDVDYNGVGRIVDEAMRLNPKVRIYQASTSEMFGSTRPPQNENSPFHPVSPYAEAKLRAHNNFVVGYREKYGLYICSGILFNHESPRRGKQFVTRKVTDALARIKLGLQDSFQLGNLDATRDWGYAKDYVEMMWLMLQQDKPRDYVIATGEAFSVRDFVNAAAKAFGMKLAWSGKGKNEVAKDEKGRIILRINPKLYRPNEVDDLLGDASKAHKELGWKPRTSFDELVKIMCEHDLKEVKKLVAISKL